MRFPLSSPPRVASKNHWFEGVTRFASNVPKYGAIATNTNDNTMISMILFSTECIESAKRMNISGIVK